MSYSDLGALALTAVGATTNDAVVSTLWKNVIGTEATTAIKAPYIKMLTDGMKVGDLVVLAADTSFNTTNINLVGLAQTGIEYLPVV
jgi:serralysin